MANVDAIDRQVIVKFEASFDCTEKISHIFPTQKISLTSRAMNVWCIEYAHSIDFDKLETFKKQGIIKSYSRNRKLSVRGTPNDTLFSKQIHHLNNIEPGQPIAYGINSVDAWDNYDSDGLTANGDQIVIAVIDEGFEFKHDDLDFFINQGEIPGDSIDNDSNGYIDDYAGWNAARNNGYIPSNGKVHGTQVSGCAAATGNNITGVCGVSQKVKILPISGMTETGIDAAIKALDYCIEMKKLYHETNGQKGAYIASVNFSIGINGGGFYPSDAPEWGEAFERLSSQGILTSVAVDNFPKDAYVHGDLPTLFNKESMINTTTIEQNSLKIENAVYSKTYVHLAAPHRLYTTHTENRYVRVGTGASYSAPLVAGVIGLMYSNFNKEFLDSLKANPPKFSKLIKETILRSVDTSPTLKDKLVTEGRISAYQSVKNASTIHLGIRSGDTTDSSDSTLSIQTINQQNDIYYHNHKLYLTSKNHQPSDLTIFDLRGRKVHYEEIPASYEKINLSLQSNGIYIAKWNYGEGFKTLKFVYE